MRPSRVGAVCLVAFLSLFMLSNLPFVPVPHPVAANTLSSVYVTPVQRCCISPTSSSPVFTVNVKMNLSSSESINGFDVRLNYTNFYAPAPPPHGVVKAVSLDYSNNVFVQRNYQVTTQASCIDDVTYGPDGFCAIDDVTGGQVHVAQTILNANMSGPVNNALLFSVTFVVNATGTSLFYIERANLVNPGGFPPNPHFVQVTTAAGIFGNDQLIAFFDYSSTLSPSVLTGVSAKFDASASFRSTSSGQMGLSSPTFRWDFGDGNKTTSTNPVALHTFRTAGNYTVGLVVNDTNPGGGSFQRTVQVSPPLGSLHVTVRRQDGGAIQTIVTVKLYNHTTPVPPLCAACTQTINAGGTVDFHGLTPGSYVLNFTGPGVDPSGKQTQVQVGWPTMETVYLTEILPPGPNITPLLIFGLVIGVGLGLAGLGLLLRWKRTKRRIDSGELARKTRKRGRV